MVEVEEVAKEPKSDATLQSNAKDRRIREQRAKIRRMQAEIDNLHDRLRVYIQWKEEADAVVAAVMEGEPVEKFRDVGYALRHGQDTIDRIERLRRDADRYRRERNALADARPSPCTEHHCCPHCRCTCAACDPLDSNGE